MMGPNNKSNRLSILTRKLSAAFDKQIVKNNRFKLKMKVSRSY